MDENSRWEFINGEVVVHSPAKYEHNSVREKINLGLQLHCLSNNLGEVGCETYLVSLTRNDYEPDIAFWSRAKSEKFIKGQMQFPSPDLIVEVLSPSTESIDRGIKFDDYALHGVAEYWIVDPLLETIEQYRLSGERFELVKKSADDTLSSVAITGLQYPTRAAFDPAIHTQFIKSVRPR